MYYQLMAGVIHFVATDSILIDANDDNLFF